MLADSRAVNIGSLGHNPEGVMTLEEMEIALEPKEIC